MACPIDASLFIRWANPCIGRTDVCHRLCCFPLSRRLKLDWEVKRNLEDQHSGWHSGARGKGLLIV